MSFDSIEPWQHLVSALREEPETRSSRLNVPSKKSLVSKGRATALRRPDEQTIIMSWVDPAGKHWHDTVWRLRRPAISDFCALSGTKIRKRELAYEEVVLRPGTVTVKRIILPSHIDQLLEEMSQV